MSEPLYRVININSKPYKYFTNYVNARLHFGMSDLFLLPEEFDARDYLAFWEELFGIPRQVEKIYIDDETIFVVSELYKDLLDKK